jgi:hypothetical protein
VSATGSHHVVRRATEHQDAAACRITSDELLPFSIVEQLVCKAHVAARVAEIAIEADLHERTELT